MLEEESNVNQRDKIQKGKKLGFQMDGSTQPHSKTKYNPYRVSNHDSYDSGMYRIVSNTIHEQKWYNMWFVSPITYITSYRGSYDTYYTDSKYS